MLPRPRLSKFGIINDHLALYWQIQHYLTIQLLTKTHYLDQMPICGDQQSMTNLHQLMTTIPGQSFLRHLRADNRLAVDGYLRRNLELTVLLLGTKLD